MELKPGYKQTEVGVIPEDWDSYSGEQVTSLIGKGSSPRWQGFAYTTDGMLFVTSENVRDGHLDVRRPKYLPLSFHDKLKRTRLKKLDILVNLVGASIGRSCQVKFDPGEANVNQAVAVFRVTDSYCSEFIAFYLQSQEAVKRILDMQVDAARPNISLSDLRRFQIPVPPRREQVSIAGLLESASLLDSSIECLITKKLQIRQAAMQELLTGKRRLPGFEGEWEVKRLGDHVRFLKNGVNSRAELYPGACVRYLHYGDIHASSGSFLSPQDLTGLPVDKATGLDRLQDGDLIFADASEDIAGVSKSVELCGISDYEAVSGLHTIAARFDKTVLADGFKGFLQYVPSFSAHLRRLAAGTKVYATNRSHISSAEVRLPPVAEQKAIAEVLMDMSNEIGLLRERMKKACSTKQGMMQQLLTGKIRLK
jgi:type I restriction enzyme S subunit